MTDRRRSTSNAVLILLFLINIILTSSSDVPSKNDIIQQQQRQIIGQRHLEDVGEPDDASGEENDPVESSTSTQQTKKTSKEATESENETEIEETTTMKTKDQQQSSEGGEDEQQDPSSTTETKKTKKTKGTPTDESSGGQGSSGGSGSSSSNPTKNKEGACATATTCDECLENAKVNFENTNNEYACQWNGSSGSCTFTTDSKSFLEMCNEVTVAAKMATDDGGEGGGFMQRMMGFLFMVGVAGGMFLMKQRLAFLGGAVMEDAVLGEGRGSMSSGSFRQETVPLSSTREDEWGWEDGTDDDNNGDLEMARRKEEEDLDMALALSLSQNRSAPEPSADDDSWAAESIPSPVPNPMAPKPKPKGTPPQTKKKSSTMTSSKPTISSYSHTMAKPPTSKLSIKKKKEAKKSDETSPDDIFATMGLAAKPTFNKPKPTKTLPTVAPKSTWASAAEGLDDDMAGSNWDDDDDLDDLLDD